MIKGKEAKAGYGIYKAHSRYSVNTSIIVPTFAMPINRHVRIMTVEDRKNNMALPREQVAGVKYGNSRIESKLDAIEKHLAKI